MKIIILKKLVVSALVFLIISCGGEGMNGTATGDNSVEQGDSSTIGNLDGAVTVNDDTMLDGLLSNLIGPDRSQRVWSCEVTDADGGVRQEFVEFGVMSNYNRSWVRFISAGGFVYSLYRVSVFDDNTLRMKYPGIERILPIFQNEVNSRTRFFREVVFSDDGSMTASYLERRLTEADIVRQFNCRVSSRQRLISAEISVWPPTPTIFEVEDLTDIRDQRIELIDGCHDGKAIRVQLLEAFNGVLTDRSWPPGADDFFVGSGSRTLTIGCAVGTDYCYAANVEGSPSDFWGINPNPEGPNRSCSTCCFACPVDYGIVPINSIRFSC